MYGGNDMQRSVNLSQKLSRLLDTDPTVVEFNQLLDLSSKAQVFNSKRELVNYLSEGALLNVGKLASKALSVPCGDYMVWMTDAGHTMLVPVKGTSNEVFEHTSDQYDIFTNTLLQNWNKLEKVLAEDAAPKPDDEEDEEYSEGDRYGSSDDEEEDELPRRIDMSSVDRTSIAQAIQDRGFTVTSVADACGVDPPAISRILRVPQNRQGDPGGRNPSMELASKICEVLRLDPKAAFPDIFGASKGDKKYVSRKGNRGSGTGGAAAGSVRKGKASKKWTQGNG
jgi:hypothetical protein